MSPFPPSMADDIHHGLDQKTMTYFVAAEAKWTETSEIPQSTRVMEDQKDDAFQETFVAKSAEDAREKARDHLAKFSERVPAETTDLSRSTLVSNRSIFNVTFGKVMELS